MADHGGRVRRYYGTDIPATHENSTTEALAGQVSIPGGYLKAGDKLFFRGFGKVIDNNSTDTLTIRTVIGGLAGTTLATSAATDVADADLFAVEGWITIVTEGASGTYHADATVWLDTTPATVRTHTITGTVNTQTATVIGIGLDWSVAHADNEATVYEFACLHYNATS